MKEHDNYSACSLSSDDEHSTSTVSSVTGLNNDRDEVKEVLNQAKWETLQVRLSRFAVTAALLFTALAVTFATFIFLETQEQRNFELSFNQYARTVRDASLEQQRAVNSAMKGFADVISSLTAGDSKGAGVWPFVTTPQFEVHAANFRSQARAEVFEVLHVVDGGGEKRKLYEGWAADNYQSMVKESHRIGYDGSLEHFDQDIALYNPELFVLTSDGPVPDADVQSAAYALWEFSPPPTSYGLINWNMFSVREYGYAIRALTELRNETIAAPVLPFEVFAKNGYTQEQLDQLHAPSPGDHPRTFYFHPIHENVESSESNIAGVLGGAVAWDVYFSDLLPSDLSGLHLVVDSTNCNQTFLPTFTYELNGPEAVFLGKGDLHEDGYSHLSFTFDFASLHSNPQFASTPRHCLYSVRIYPSATFFSSFDYRTAEVFSTVVMFTFFIVAMVFFLYDFSVHIRQLKLVQDAARSNAIVSSLFPDNIRDRLINAQQDQAAGGKIRNNSLKSFMVHGGQLVVDTNSQPLADLFLETTVLFADIAGFTAWSSSREPSQVFTLLETIYASFDVIAQRRRVFKVETVGDCYVAVTGLPDYRKDHATAMARFAQDILHRMDTLTKELETTLGPDTGDLDIRIGMHSGPVTAGVLRGERSRFQLFGDTMNTASRMESTSKRGCIQVSTHTAALLEEAGKSSWLRSREDKIEAKGKGIMETYWLSDSKRSAPSAKSASSTGHLSTAMMTASSVDGDGVAAASEKLSRLVNWNVVQLLKLIRQIVARRNAQRSSNSVVSMSKSSADTVSSGNTSTSQNRPTLPAGKDKLGDNGNRGTPLQEVKEIITLPEFDSEVARRQQDQDSVDLPPIVEVQLRDYVTAIANMYRNNPFHNFDHCSHVVMSVIKLMARIVAPTDVMEDEFDGGKDATRRRKMAAALHDHTYGITSDPLTQFACVLSALIHDVDHTGVPNTQLVQENPQMAGYYKNRSVAEQNSLDLSWELLMEDRYSELRGCLYGDEKERNRFRELVVNSVMATDIADKELKELRNARWEKAFTPKAAQEEQAASAENLKQVRDDVNRKATIVIEHLIQASDVSHTMQHWHVFRKWNENLFMEMYRAYQEGRAEKNPAEFWYKGEIGFFDFYIIPLAKKLKDCGVFGKSSDEYLNYAQSNRNEWERRGDAVVAEMVEKIAAARGDTTDRDLNDHSLAAYDDEDAAAAFEEMDDQFNDDGIGRRIYC